MKDTIDILNKLSRLDLSSFPIDKVKKYLNHIGTGAQIGYTVHPGNSIFRVRPNESSTDCFNARQDLQYKPQKYSTEFQRASTPKATMFYGSIVPEKFNDEDLKIGRATACFETAKTFRNNWFSSKEKITFSRWDVIQDIKLIMIAYSPRFLRTGSILTDLNEEFRNQIGQFDKSLLKKAMAVNELQKYSLKEGYE